MEQFKLSSPSLKTGEMVPEKFTFNGMGCKGKNMSPALEWEGAPGETRSFALTVIDPDAPHADGGWRHWTLVNIPASISAIAEDASAKGLLPESALEVENDFDETHYGGPCPPRGDKPHRYVFTLYAMKTDHLNLTEHSDRASVDTLLESNSIAKTTFTVRYKH
jgi:Raf kinase inhibitor-like YbhB/YbcL family protein